MIDKSVEVESNTAIAHFLNILAITLKYHTLFLNIFANVCIGH